MSMDDFFKKQDEALQAFRDELAERCTKLLQEIHPGVEVHFEARPELELPDGLDYLRRKEHER